MTFKLKLCAGFFISSVIFGFVAAYLHDFHPTLRGFHALFVIKTVSSTLLSIAFWMGQSMDNDYGR